MLEETLKLNKKLDLALCICSSNSYKDIWDIFIFFWKKNFSYINIPIYILTSEKIENENSFYEVIYPKNLSSDDPWSNRMYECLKQINHENIITTTEDAIVNKKINFEKLYLSIKHFSEKKLDYLKLSPYYPNKSNENLNKFVYHHDWELHRVNITKALWKKNSLLKLLNNGESFKEFDMFASIRAKELKMKIKHCDFTTIPYLEIINGGKFNFLSKKILRNYSTSKQLTRSYSSVLEDFIMRYNYLKLYIYSILPIYLKKILIDLDLIGYKNKYKRIPKKKFN